MGLAPNGEGNAGNSSDSRFCNAGEGRLGDSLQASGAPHLALKSLSVLFAVLPLKTWRLLLTRYLQPLFQNICLVLNKYAFQLLNGLLSIFNPERVMNHE